MEIDDKGGEIVQRYESFEIEIVHGGEIRYKSSKKQRLDMDMDKEGAILKKEMDQNSQTREAHKQGEQAHEL